MESNIFATQLKKALEVRRLTQAELAEKTGLMPSAVSHFMSGLRKPSFENIRRISKALEVSTDFLLGRSDDPNTTSSSVDELNRHASLIKSSEDREKLIEYARMLADKPEE